MKSPDSNRQVREFLGSVRTFESVTLGITAFSKFLSGVPVLQLRERLLILLEFVIDLMPCLLETNLDNLSFSVFILCHTVKWIPNTWELVTMMTVGKVHTFDQINTQLIMCFLQKPLLK